MRFTIKLSFQDEDETETLEKIIHFDKGCTDTDFIGISLDESKQLLKKLQARIILQQAKQYTEFKRNCCYCGKKQAIKGVGSIQYRTLLGIVNLPNPRFCYCQCHHSEVKTFSALSKWLDDKNSSKLQYIETKWASLISFNQTANLLKDILPIGQTENAATVRNHLHNIAKHQEQELEGKPEYISGCQNEWNKLPKPDKPITVGIDGGYLKRWKNKGGNFEIIAGKSFSSTRPTIRFGLVQKLDEHPKRRLMHVLTHQGMQANQQITFLSDGADNVRELQFMMYPESEHILDWFHITMRITVLNQFAKGMIHSDKESGEELTKYLESTKWYLWHGNVKNALDRLEDGYLLAMDDEIKYRHSKKLIKYLEEFVTYIENNACLITNYGEKWRYGETISTGFVESTINEVVAKRMVKKQQMQWSDRGAHNLLQTRTAVLNNELHAHFERWFPGFSMKSQVQTATSPKKLALAA